VLEIFSHISAFYWYIYLSGSKWANRPPTRWRRWRYDSIYAA
jgi:hypothetical protein